MVELLSPKKRRRQRCNVDGQYVNKLSTKIQLTSSSLHKKKLFFFSFFLSLYHPYNGYEKQEEEDEEGMVWVAVCTKNIFYFTLHLTLLHYMLSNNKHVMFRNKVLNLLLLLQPRKIINEMEKMVMCIIYWDWKKFLNQPYTGAKMIYLCYNMAGPYRKIWIKTRAHNTRLVWYTKYTTGV